MRPPKWKRPYPLPISYAVQHERSSPKFAGAFAQGCGGVATGDADLRPNAPMALFGSPERWDLLQQHIATGQDWYYADHAYFRRGRQYRIARNAYQSIVDPLDVATKYEIRKQSQAQPVEPPARFKNLHVNVEPEWKRNGSAILICPNSPTYMRWFGYDAQQWAIDVARELAKYTDRPMIIRWKAQHQVRPFYVDIHDAWATVVFSSGAAVESLTHGVPVFVLADWATTRPMGSTDLSRIETPYYPDYREPFLWELAERQWTIEEIRAGVAWQWFMQREDDRL